MSKSPQNIVLKCWGEGWGLPSIDIDCLSAIMYSYISKSSATISPSLPKDTITGLMPEIQVEDFVYSRAFSVISIFRREGYNSDFPLTEDANADTLAFLSYIDQKLRPAILFTLWLDASNYTKVTRAEYGKLCGFPWSLWYPSKIRREVQELIMQTKGLHSSLQDIERRLYKDAQICLNVMEKKLGSSEFFFGNFPSTLDAVLFGHLGVLMKAPLISTELQHSLNSHDKLKKFCYRMEKYLPKQPTPASPTKSLQAKEPFLKHDQVISIMVALSAMVVYAISSGVLTAKRSKLAQSIESFKNENHRDDSVAEIDDLDTLT